MGDPPQQKFGGLHQGNSPTPTIDHLQRQATIDQSKQLSCDDFVILVQRSQKIRKKFEHLVFLRNHALVERVHRLWELRGDAKEGASNDARRVHGTLDRAGTRRCFGCRFPKGQVRWVLDEEIQEIVANVALFTFANYINLVIRTKVDFPLVMPMKQGAAQR